MSDKFSWKTLWMSNREALIYIGGFLLIVDSTLAISSFWFLINWDNNNEIGVTHKRFVNDLKSPWEGSFGRSSTFSVLINLLDSLADIVFDFLLFRGAQTRNWRFVRLWTGYQYIGIAFKIMFLILFTMDFHVLVEMTFWIFLYFHAISIAKNYIDERRVVEGEEDFSV